MKKIAILGASGSIGLQAIDVIVNHPESFKLCGIAIGKKIEMIDEILKRIHIPHISIQDAAALPFLRQKYPNINFYSGEEGLIKIATLTETDVVLNAVVGFVGVIPTIEAIKYGKDIALANKETLVAAGPIIKKLVKEYNVALIPVDSEHSAIFQSLNGESHKDVKRLIITASGGSFRDLSRIDLTNVSVEDALNHPNWSMGAKITIDSATMFNKGLEVIEAHYLFDIDYNQIDVLIHQESVIHSLVEYVDTSFIAQLGLADMRLPIQYAFTYPQRLPLVNAKPLDLAEIGELHFKAVDFNRYPALKLAYEAGRKGGSAPVVLNAANEAAVALFLNEKITFLQIEALVEKALHTHIWQRCDSIETILEVDQWARHFVNKTIGGLKCQEL